MMARNPSAGCLGSRTKEGVSFSLQTTARSVRAANSTLARRRYSDSRLTSASRVATGAIEKEHSVNFPDQKIEEDFALRREKGRVARGTRRDAVYVVGDEPLQEVAGLGPGNGDHGAVVEPEGHEGEVMPPRAVAKAGSPP